MPSLTMLTGEWPGKVFRLARDVTVIGKRPDCDLVLPDRHVSRSHARIVRREDGHYIENLENTNETKVGGEPLQAPRLLSDGDLIKICKYTLVYGGSDDRSAGSARILQTIDLTVAASALPARDQAEEKLRAILEITSALSGVLDAGAVSERVLEVLFRLFPQAERGFVLSRPGSGGPPAIESSRLRDARAGRVLPSRAVYDLVAGEGQAVLLEDLLADGRLSESRSVGEAEVRSIMCAPLFDRDRRPVGVLQLDARDGRQRFRREDLDFLVAVAGTLGMVMENARLHAAEVRVKQIEQEARDAWAVERSLIPEHPPSVPGYELWHHYEPARFVGGDYLGYPATGGGRRAAADPPRRWAVAVGDVAGKGMPAALLMARVAAEVRLLLQRDSDPARVVAQLNRGLCAEGPAGRFVTFLLALLDAEGHRLSLVDAGHSLLTVRRADGRLETKAGDPQRAGLPLGVLEDEPYRAVPLRLGPGDVVVIYTDGVLDARNPQDEAFGAARLGRCIAEAPAGAAAVGAAIRDAVHAHAAGQEQFDDITLACLGRT